MQIQSAREGLVATVAPAGLIDTRASQEFERHVVGLFNEGARAVIVDLSKVDLITSAGIRVLVMMAQRLQRSGGGLVLCALSDTVRSVFDIAGLLSQFRITGTRDEAATLLASVQAGPATGAPAVSRVTRLLRQVLAEDDAPVPGGPAAGDARSPVTAHVADVLAPSDADRPARG